MVQRPDRFRFTKIPEEPNFQDHYSGLDRLLPQVRIDTVIMPYLTAFERVLLVAKAMEDDTLVGDDVLLLGDPLTWLFSRNVKRVIFITPGHEDDAPQFPDVNPIRPPGETPDEKSQYSRPGLELDEDTINSNAVFRATSNGGNNVVILPDTVPVPLSHDGSKKNWCFLTFVHPEYALASAFAKQLQAEMNSPLPIDPPGVRGLPPVLTAWMLNILQDRSKRDRLAGLYKAGFRDRNLTSLSLYSGPITTNQGYYKLPVARPPTSKLGDILKTEIAWLGTGDADLKDPIRRAAFLTHYAAVMPHVATMAIPHHGSRHNFDESILPPNLSLAVVGVALKGRYGHPHPEVENALKLRKVPLKRVTERDTTKQTESFLLVPR